MNDTPDSPTHLSPAFLAATSPAIVVLALMFFLLPAVGVPSELLLQDTLKSAIAALGTLLAGFLYFWPLRSRSCQVMWHGLIALPLLLLFYALGSMAWSHTYLAGVEAIRWFIVALLAWIAMNAVARKDIPLIAWGIHGGAVVASFWVALQFYLDYSLFPQAAPPASTFINRNFFAEYLVCTIPWSVYALANMRLSPRAWAVALSLALNITAILMTGTRSALLAMLVMAPFVGLFLHRCIAQLACSQWTRTQRFVVVASMGVCIAVMGVIPSKSAQILAEGAGETPLQRSVFRVKSMARSTEYQEGTFSVRMAMWKATARMMLAHGLTGVGAGAWEVQIPLYQNEGTTYETDYYAHNEYLQLLSEYGVVVGGLFLAFLLAYWLIAAKSTWELSSDQRPEAPLRATVLICIAGLLIVSNAGFPWHLAGCGTLFALCLGILSRSDADLGNRQRLYASTRSLPAYANAAVLIAFAGLICAALYVTHQAQRAEQHIVQALKLSAAMSKAASKGEATDETKKMMLEELRAGIAITPHYRRLTALAAEPLSASGDWKNATWVLESIAQSRPNIAAVWTGLAVSYSKQGEHDRARLAYAEVLRLRPNAIATKALEISLLIDAGRFDDAIPLLTRHYDQGDYNYDMVQLGSAIGYETRNWPLAIRALELRNNTWPQYAADGHYRLGQIFANEAMRDDDRALKEFRLGLASVPEDYVKTYLQQVPVRFRSSL